MRLRTMLSLIALTTAPVAAQTAPAGNARGDHIAIASSDVGRSIAFYQRIFGLVEKPAAVPGARWLDLGGMMLHIIPGRTAPVADVRANHLALAVTDFAALLSRLEADGIPFTDFAGKPSTVNRVRSDKVRQIFVRDPDGYWIEINDRAGR